MAKVVPSEHLQEEVASNGSDLTQVLDFTSVLMCMRVDGWLKDDPYALSKVLIDLADLGIDLINEFRLTFSKEGKAGTSQLYFFLKVTCCELDAKLAIVIERRYMMIAYPSGCHLFP